MPADVSGITAALPQGGATSINPLEIMKSVQSIQNAQQQNKLMQQDLLNRQAELGNIQQTGKNLELTNQIGSQGLASARMNRARTIMFDLSNRADGTLAGGQVFKDALDAELTSGTIDKQAHDIALQQIDAITKKGGDKDGSLYRPMLNSAFASTMSPAEQVEFLRGKVQSSTLPGGQTQQVVVPGMGSAPGTQTQNLGSPYGGGINPEAGTDIVTVQAPDGTTKQFTRQQLNQFNLQQQGWKVVPQGAGTTVAPPGAAGGGQPLAPTPPSTEKPPPVGGPNPAPAPKETGQALPTPISTSSPMVIAQNAKDQETYNGVMQDAPTIRQNVQDLTEAYNLVKGLSSGKGLDYINQKRSLLASWGRRLGIDTGGVNSEDKAYDLANKILTRITMNTPGAGQSVMALDAAGHSTPNLGNMNHDAAMDAMKQMVGSMRQKYAAAMNHDPNSLGRGFIQAQAAHNMATDRDGFASDFMTQQEIMDRVKQLGGPASARGKAFLTSVAMNKRLFSADVGSSVDQ